jgi:hypothetical protein
VRVPVGLFNHTTGKIAAIEVTFVNGGIATLLPSSAPNEPFVSNTANVAYPLRDVLLGKPIGNWYRYKVVVAWENGTVSPSSEPIANDAQTFLLHVPQLS